MKMRSSFVKVKPNNVFLLVMVLIISIWVITSTPMINAIKILMSGSVKTGNQGINSRSGGSSW